VAFLGAQLLLGLVILLQLNTYTQLLGVASLGLVAAYPLVGAGRQQNKGQVTIQRLECFRVVGRLDSP
jgi:4-hydroxybenzoate polyprenyltransferase